MHIICCSIILLFHGDTYPINSIHVYFMLVNQILIKITSMTARSMFSEQNYTLYKPPYPD